MQTRWKLAAGIGAGLILGFIAGHFSQPYTVRSQNLGPGVQALVKIHRYTGDAWVLRPQDDKWLPVKTGSTNDWRY